jgi:pyruvate/2-oxoacid:ferredoxin oxidoreductase alpha subunit
MTHAQNMTGTSAVAHAARLAHVAVVAAYPITPQTRIIESIAEFIADGAMDTRFIQVESEHSALAAVIAAASNGVRTFTATSSQGLLYMHEMMHWAAAARVPVVMANVNRAVAPPWNIYSDHQDAISQRDTGWIQLFAETNQDALDLTLQAFRIAEDRRVRLPVMVNLDGFTLSHTYEPVCVPPASEVDSFLPAFQGDEWLDPRHPMTINGVVSPEHYTQFRALQRDAMCAALSVVEETAGRFAEVFGHVAGGTLQGVDLEDADVIFVAMGSTASTVRGQVEAWRAEGKPVGMVSVRSYRPFPADALRRLLSASRVVVVWDRAYSFGCGGPLATEIRAAVSGGGGSPKVLSAIGGLGGSPIGPQELNRALIWAEKALREEGAQIQELWFGVKPRREERDAAL